jgi:hypothetical protein
MLTAQKENDHLKPLLNPKPTLRSLDKVVDSIAGLRERVQSFDDEQLSATEQKLQTMSLRLGELQQTLRLLSGTTQRMSQLHELVQQAEAKSLEQNRLLTLESAIPTRSLAQVESLLKFQRLIKLLRTTEAVSGLLDPANKTVQTLSRIATPSKEEHANKRELSAAVEPIVQGSADSLVQTAPTEAPLAPEKVQDVYPPEIDFEEFEFSSEDSPNVISADERIPIIQENEPNVVAAETTEQPQPREIDTTLNAGQTHTEASQEADFDRQLLEDLIKNYGEFTVLPGLPSKGNDERKRDTIRSTPRLHSATNVNVPSHRNVPAQRKDGELDRKLKKLIKDYGEYDLYSKQSPVKLKTGVAGAFLILTLILSGFYFFSSPKSTASTNTSAASESPVSLDAPKEPSGEGKKRGGETVTSGSGSKTTEAAATSNTTNKTKK